MRSVNAGLKNRIFAQMASTARGMAASRKCRLCIGAPPPYVWIMAYEFDIIIIGGGAVGLTMALACAKSGASVAMVDRRALDAEVPDGRAFALAATSLTLLSNLDVDLGDRLQPIRDMLVTEGAPDSPWRLHFEGDGDGSDLGGMIRSPDLGAALLARVEAEDAVTVFAPFEAKDIIHDASGVSLKVGRKVLKAKLLVAADGRESRLRKAAGITVQRSDYDMASLVTTIAHELPHDGLAWQRFSTNGPLAVLPLTDGQSQIVWSAPTDLTAAAVALPEADFLALLSDRMDGYLGDMTLAAPRQSYPLRLQVADSFTATRLALVGDAAHIIHPLAGQGLNLGLRDAAALSDGVKSAQANGQDIGVAGLIDYQNARMTDARMMGATTHMLSMITQVKTPAFGHLRRMGLALTNRSQGLKSRFKKEAAGRTGTPPELMR